ncbi:hypothetical protein [Moorena sp. SIO4G3]|nr:hypothetical protein [Moorena sp. SIO4G3]NEO80696.1 hypothetical protein [Moorena sp. SIO4G3]
MSKKSHFSAACQVTETGELARISGQLSRANRPPTTDKKDFGHKVDVLLC